MNQFILFYYINLKLKFNKKNSFHGILNISSIVSKKLSTTISQILDQKNDNNKIATSCNLHFKFQIFIILKRWN